MMIQNFFIVLFIFSGWAQVAAQPLLHWQMISTKDIQLPEQVTVYKATGNLDGDSITAYYTLTDISDGEFVFFPLYSSKNQKPQEYYQTNPDDIIVMTNGGYFGADVSYSLVMNANQTLVPNIRAVVRPHNNKNYTYYPTRGAFGVTRQLQPQASWVYTPPVSDTTYSYPAPAPNTLSELPLPQPDAAFPDGGTPWQVSEAIGGGPLLIADSSIITDFTPELFYNDIIATKAPRTAVGRTTDGKIINLVVDGRQAHSKGVTLKTLAKILLDLGCTEAINLDGGGSSFLMIGDSVINKPSDGTTRSIPSVVAIQRAHIFDTHNPAHFKVETPTDSLNSGFGPSGSLILEAGHSAFYHFPLLKPAKYRIAFYLNKNHSLPLTDSLRVLVWRNGMAADTFLLDQARHEQGFLIAGEAWLSSSDSIELMGMASEKKALADAVRLMQVASGKPQIDFVPKSYGRLYSKGDTVTLVVQAQSRMEERPITNFKIYGQTDNMQILLDEKSFEPTAAYLDSITYIVSKMKGSVSLSAYVADALGDSSGITYTVTIDDSPPLIRPGRESVLSGKVGDSLTLILMLEAARESRPLKALEVHRNTNETTERLDSIPVNGLTDTLVYFYVLTNADKGGVTINATITDVMGYNNSWSYRFLPFTGIHSFNGGHYNIWYDAPNELLHIDVQKAFPGKYKVIITNLSGKIFHLAQNTKVSDNTIDVDALPPGFYVVTIQSKKGVFSQKFVKMR